MNQETWLERNTFHHGAFWDLIKLVKEKEKKGLKISLCIPTLNEEKTIGKEVLILRSELMERVVLTNGWVNEMPQFCLLATTSIFTWVPVSAENCSQMSFKLFSI